jgi:acetyl-CoA/propionyl-CoA carboxylase biotin carboxyl carrier protein
MTTKPTLQATTDGDVPTRARTFDTILVANRGEIACRILRTLRAEGIRSVAVYSDADRGALHVALADVAVRIGPAPARQSYLNIDAILAAAAASGAEAIHPGYGFLSENEGFARAVAEAGLVFIGPSVHALSVMGDKIRSKNHVAVSGVPVIPGIAEPGLSDQQLIVAADSVGFPLLIKPSAGGGGKGMHVVERAADLAEALAAARRVASRSFGDDTLFLERLVPAPRHIEVQVLADNHGHVIHLGERECSLQRRHQKVIEEAPSSLLDEQTRARIGEAACAAARSVDYRGAGTVEFLVSDAEPDRFFFMEMNTRLQVEHPVTELVTGIDLVAWQVRIAAGEHLTLAQEDVVLHGHAIEARVYAENPQHGFLPATGMVRVLAEPAGEGIRVDSSLTPDLVVGSDYDPMLSKVIAWGENREQALTRLDRALAETLVLGVPTNIEYLRLLLADADVQAGRLDTGLIERKLPNLAFAPADDHIRAAAALYVRMGEWLHANPVWARPTGWRLGRHRPTSYALSTGADEIVDVRVDGAPDAAWVAVGDQQPVPAGIRSVPGSVSSFSIEVDGVTRVVDIVREADAGSGSRIWIGHAGSTFLVTHRTRAEQLAALLAGRNRLVGAVNPEVRSPMPGTVITVTARTGDTVEAGDTLLSVEAMKMEHKLLAAVPGIVTISVAPGDLVKLDQVVAVIDPPAPTPSDPAAADDAPLLTPVQGDDS